MKVWRIDNDRYDNIEKELREDKSFELPKPWQGPLALLDEETGKHEKKSTASYLFITEEGTCGRLQLKGPLYQKYIPGSPCMSGGGLRYDFVYEGGEESKPEVERKTPDPLNSSDILIHGRVADESGTPVAGAKLFLPVKYEDDKRLAKATADEAGRFSLRVPREWAKPGPLDAGFTIWCYAPKHRIATAQVWKQLWRQSDAPIGIVLESETDTGFEVKNLDGDLIRGARVEPVHFLTSAGYEIVPAALCEVVGAETNGRGVALFPAMGRDCLSSIRVVAEGYGVQEHRLRDSAKEPAIRRIRLSPTGRLEGRLLCEDKRVLKGLRVHIWQDESPEWEFPHEYATAAGSVEVDEEGRFVFPACAGGSILLAVPVEASGAWAPRIPEKVEVASGETTKVEIPFERTVRVRGRVRIKETDEPVADAMASVSYGDSRFQCNQVRTDADGRFETNVLPGKVRQHASISPIEYSNWVVETPGPGYRTPIRVPAGVETFDLPPVNLIPTVEHSGRLVDRENRPVAEAGIRAIGKDRSPVLREDRRKRRVHPPPAEGRRGREIRSHSFSRG